MGVGGVPICLQYACECVKGDEFKAVPLKNINNGLYFCAVITETVPQVIFVVGGKLPGAGRRILRQLKGMQIEYVQIFGFCVAFYHGANRSPAGAGQPYIAAAGNGYIHAEKLFVGNAVLKKISPAIGFAQHFVKAGNIQLSVVVGAGISHSA